MKLGILAYSSKTGLGYQTLDYYKYLNPDKVMHIDLSPLNGEKQNLDWYNERITQRVVGYPRETDIDQFLTGLDVVLMAETPLNYNLYARARRMGVKTATAYNFEFFDHFLHPEYELPDLLIAPSMWRFDEIDRLANARGSKHIYLHHPVDRQRFSFRERTGNKPIHLAGKPAAHDRNGTDDYLQAVPDGTVITQSEELARRLRMQYRNSRIVTDVKDPKQIYDFGDIMVLPRRYGGNCLPLNEALSCGMPVIMPDISPNNHLLPKEWLVPASITSQFEPRTKVDIYSTDIQALRDKIEWFRSQDIAVHSQKANEIADSISWETLKPKWIEVLESL